MGRKLNDLTGKKFGRLTVLNRVESIKPETKWLCVCDDPCGQQKIVDASSLVSGRTISCGCARIKHGACKRGQTHRAYDIWRNMKSRCYYKKDTYYANYGGRGIKVYKAWIDSYETFRDYILGLPDCPDDLQLSDVTLSHTIDRIRNNEGYKPGNIQWSTRSEQQNNTRRNIVVNIDDKSMTLAEAVQHKGNASYDTIYHRFRVLKWTLEKALSTPGK